MDISSKFFPKWGLKWPSDLKEGVFELSQASLCIASPKFHIQNCPCICERGLLIVISLPHPPFHPGSPHCKWSVHCTNNQVTLRSRFQRKLPEPAVFMGSIESRSISIFCETWRFSVNWHFVFRQKAFLYDKYNCYSKEELEKNFLETIKRIIESEESQG